MITEKYGIWGGKHPAHWCHIFAPHLPALENEYCGSMAHVEYALADFRRDYPDTNYEIVLYDREREPVADTTHNLSSEEAQIMRIILLGVDPYQRSTTERRHTIKTRKAMTCPTCKSERCGNHAACARRNTQKQENLKANEVILVQAIQDLVYLK
jgi:hypothetical protein